MIRNQLDASHQKTNISRSGQIRRCIDIDRESADSRWKQGTPPNARPDPARSGGNRVLRHWNEHAIHLAGARVSQVRHLASARRPPLLSQTGRGPHPGSQKRHCGAGTVNRHARKSHIQCSNRTHCGTEGQLGRVAAGPARSSRRKSTLLAVPSLLDEKELLDEKKFRNCSPLIQAPKTQQQFQSQLLRHDASFTFGCGDSNRLLLILSLRLSFSASFVQSGSTAREFMT